MGVGDAGQVIGETGVGGLVKPKGVINFLSNVYHALALVRVNFLVKGQFKLIQASQTMELCYNL